MADRTIQELDPISLEVIKESGREDSYVLEHADMAYRLTGDVLISWLLYELDGHGGIHNIAKTGTSGLVDTYTVTLADGQTYNFTVTNGRSIVRVAITSPDPNQSPIVDKYNINYNNNTVENFYVTNGRGITNIQKTGTDVLDDTYTVSYNDTTTSAFVITNGRGITNIEKTSTSGLEDTYTISYNNNTTSTFIVTNGEKGDKPIPTTSNTEVRYGKSASSSTIPTSWYSYIDDIGAINPGEYLWTRVKLGFDVGQMQEFYTATRYGLNGTGAVNSVNGFYPDINGNVYVPIDPYRDFDISVTESSASSITLQDERITANHCVRQDTSAIPLKDITWTTSDGSVTLSSSVGIPTMKITLYLPR